MVNWKIVAIIFIIISIVEFSFISWIWQLGSESMENESACAYNICDGSDSYYYDNYENMCYCYLNGEISNKEYIK